MVDSESLKYEEPGKEEALSRVLLKWIEEGLNKRTSGNNSFRVIHGKGNVIPGLSFLSLDIYGDLVYLCLYRTIHGFSCRLFADFLFQLIYERVSSGTLSFSVQLYIQDRTDRKNPLGYWWKEYEKQQFTAEENYLKYIIDPGLGQNPGLFLDTRPARIWVKQNSDGRRVLNLFSYTCAFSVSAIAGNASCVHNWDMSRNVLTRGRQNHRLNFPDSLLKNVSFNSHNILKSLGNIEKNSPYDLIILDPPSFQGSSFQLEKNLFPLMKRMAKCLSQNGILLVCINDPSLNRNWFPDLLLNLPYVLTNCLIPSSDFPEENPENSLKMYILCQKK